MIIQRLTKHLSSQKWPRLTHLDIAGQHFELPISGTNVNCCLAQLGKLDMAYLAGFFDGDGCVFAGLKPSSLRLSVKQCAANSTVLLHFLVKFGGAIGLSSAGLGSCRPALQWQVYGDLARGAASTLLNNGCLVKRDQLRIATTWPNSQRLKQLKQMRPNIEADAPVCWSYVTGFFDAEGCIKVSAKDRQVVVELAQKNPEILKAIRSFIIREMPTAKVAIYTRNLSKYSLVMGCAGTVMPFLQHLLTNGLLVKRPTALHVLMAQQLSHAGLRKNVGLVKGNQAYFQKLDENGCRRARRISSLARSHRRAQRQLHQMAATEKLRGEVEAAKLEHAILNSQSRIQKLRSCIASIRRMHKEGASSTSSWIDYVENPL